VKPIVHYSSLFLLLIVLLFSVSCSNEPAEIPLPPEPEFLQPVNHPLTFSAPSKITWMERAVIKPLIKKLNFAGLPLKMLDSGGFTPMADKPKIVKFNWDKLPDTAFNINNLPSKPLRFETSLLEPSRTVKIGHPSIKTGINSIIHEFTGLQGIGGTTVTCIIQDRSGFFWIASDTWLFRYDGENIKLFMPIQPNTWVVRMIEDGDGNIWMATNGNRESNGLMVLNPKAGILKQLTKKNGLSGNFIIDIFADAEHRIWMAMADDDGAGINIIDEVNRKIIYLDRSAGLSGLIVRAFKEDAKKNIWISIRGGGVNIVDLKNGRLKFLNKEQGLYTDTVSMLARDSSDKMWVASRFGELDEVDVAAGTIRHFGNKQGLDRHYVGALEVDNDGKIWLGTATGAGIDRGRGVIVVDPRKESYKVIYNILGPEAVYIQDILLDKRGQVWISPSSGLYILNRNGNNIEHSGKNDITTLAEDNKGQIWMGMLNGKQGVHILDPENMLFRTLSTANGLFSDSIQNILVADRNIWIGTNEGIDIVDSSLKFIRHYGRDQGLISNNESIFAQDTKGNMWMGAPTSGPLELQVLNLKNDTIRQMILPPDLNKISVVTDIKKDRKGKMWFGSYTGGILEVDPEKNSIRSVENVPAFKDQDFNILFSDEQDNMWVGTNSGLFRINATRDSLIKFSLAEGMIGVRITSLNEYNGRIYAGTRSGLTILTPPALNSEKTWKLKSFGKGDGFVKLSNSYISDIITRDGYFLWGDRGITRMPASPSDTSLPETFITGIDIFNQPQYFTDKPWLYLNGNDTIWTAKKDSFYTNGRLPVNTLFTQQEKMKWDSITTSYNLPRNLRLPYYQNYLQFHFNQSHTSGQDTTWYRYVLLGYDHNWSDRSYNPLSRYYLDLPAGKYTLKVTSMANGNWSQPASFSFAILPPWWQTWWAYALDILVVSGLAWAFARYRSRKLKKENILLENKITQRTAQLQKSLEDLKTTQTQLIQSEKMASLGELTAGIAHEIQNPLNFVNNFSEVNLEMNSELREKIEKLGIAAEEKSDLEELLTNIELNEKKINHHGKRADAIVKGMLQHSRSSNGLKEVTDFNALADEYLRLSYHGLRAKDKQFNVNLVTRFDEQIGKINIIPQDFGRVLLNLYNNAMYSVGEKKKQLNGNYDPTITVTTKKENGKVEIIIADNGLGIPKKVLDKIFQPFFTTKPTGEGTGLGLSLSYDIIKAHDGEISVNTKDGEGAEFIITLHPPVYS
jgi:signal transduction histidine kinase/ligand-binding sensor domain-containing protein